MKIKLFLGHGGYCVANARHVVKNDPKSKIKFHALFGLIHHQDKGWILFDTAYTKRFYEATKSYPNRIYANLTKVFVNDDDTVVSQLKNFGIAPEEISHVIISHFHADHIGGLKDFNNAQFYCSERAYSDLKKTRKWLGFSKGILHDLIPSNFDERVVLIEDCSSKNEDKIFGHKFDLFKDRSIYIYELPGHAAGQIGILIETEKKSYFLIADSCWDQRAYKEHKLPNKIVKLFFDSWKDYVNSIDKITQFHKANPQTSIVPTHCFATTKKLVSTNFDMDVL